MPNWVQNIIEVTGPADQLSALVEKVKGDDGRDLSFEKIIPMPESMRIPYSSASEDAFVFAVAKKYGVNITKIPKKFVEAMDPYGYRGLKKSTRSEGLAEKAQEKFNAMVLQSMQSMAKLPESGDNVLDSKLFSDPFCPNTKEEFFRVGQITIENLESYGVKNWYDWSCENWGTKWDASESQIDFVTDDKLQICFQTAWDFPEPVIRKMSELFPQLKFVGKYASEDIGSNCGTFEFFNGSGTTEELERSDTAIRFACDVWGYDYDEYMAECEEE